MKVRDKYEELLQSGDLLELFPNLTGNWEEDREEFTENFIEIGKINLDFEG